MSGTRSPSPTAPATDRETGPGGPDPGRWSVGRLALVLYPFVAGAAAINLFMLGLMGPAVGWPVAGPLTALAAGIVTGVPLSVLAGRWVRRLMDQAG